MERRIRNFSIFFESHSILFRVSCRVRLRFANAAHLQTPAKPKKELGHAGTETTDGVYVTLDLDTH